MNCSHCSLEPEILCFCSNTFLCPSHLGPHILKPGPHSYESLNCHFPLPESSILQQHLIKTLNQIKTIKQHLTSESKNLLKTIKTLLNTSLKSLENYSSTLKNFLNRQKFSVSEISEVKKIIQSDSEIQFIEKLNIDKELETFFLSQNFWVKKGENSILTNFFKQFENLGIGNGVLNEYKSVGENQIYPCVECGYQGCDKCNEERMVRKTSIEDEKKVVKTKALKKSEVKKNRRAAVFNSCENVEDYLDRGVKWDMKLGEDFIESD